MPFVCILGEVNISYIFCFTFRDLLTFNASQNLIPLIHVDISMKIHQFVYIKQALFKFANG